jgi:hypothetical protein
MDKRNPLKILMIVVVILLVAVIAVQLFVPKTITLADGTTGKLSTFKKRSPVILSEEETESTN